MKNYIYQNNLIAKKQLRQILGWCFTTYDSMQACSLADELKYVGFRYATQSGISISIEDLQVPFTKDLMLERANEEILNSEKIYVKGKITDVERFQKIIDTWSLTSEALKTQVVNYFKTYDPLNSVYIMAFSGARGNLSQVRQLVGMRGLMSDPSGEIMNLPIKKNFREGLTITDYLMSGYGARKGIVDTALKTANSGYLTRRLIDVAQDILIREKDCTTNHSFLIKITQKLSDELLGRVLNQQILDKTTLNVLAPRNTQITPTLIEIFKSKKISQIYVRSPLTCQLYRALCQQCYGWDLATENLVDMGEAIGILAGQSIGEPGTQLTMRTFHTGGIFTSEAREQVISPLSGIVQFSKLLKTVPLRTNRGEDVLLTKTAGSLLIIPILQSEHILKIDIARNTILFPKHNQFLYKDSVIGELINANRQVKREVKPILATTAGQVIVPKLKTRLNSLYHNKILWLLEGSLYNSSLSSYINFHSDYKLNNNSFIFRSKMVSSYTGNLIFKNINKSLYQSTFFIKTRTYSLQNARVFQLSKSIDNIHGLLQFQNLSYFINTSVKDNKTYLKLNRNKQFGQLISNTYKTKVGGILYYDLGLLERSKPSNSPLYFGIIKTPRKLKKEIFLEGQRQLFFDETQLELIRQNKPADCFSRSFHRTLILLEQETVHVICDLDVLFVEDGDYIPKRGEVFPDYFSKTSGLLSIKQRQNQLITVTIKSGIVYLVYRMTFVPFSDKLYFPGEHIYYQVGIRNLSLCAAFENEWGEQVLVQNVILYEFPNINSPQTFCKNSRRGDNNVNLQTDLQLAYSSPQMLRSKTSATLVRELVSLDSLKYLTDKFSIELINNKKSKALEFQIYNQINFNNYILPKLKYKNLVSCSLIQTHQFIDCYTTFAYLESLTSKSLEIVKFKINQTEIKQILLISNDNCEIIAKDKLPNQKVNDFIMHAPEIKHVGQIIIDNKNFFTLQKGRPYFFPKCPIDSMSDQNNLTYKMLPPSRINKPFFINKNKKVFLTYFSRSKIILEKSLEKASNSDNDMSHSSSFKIKFSKMFLKRNGKLYSCLIPRFLQQFTIGIKSSKRDLIHSKLFRYKERKRLRARMNNRLLIQTSDTLSNHSLSRRLTLVQFSEYPFTNTAKAVGLYSITEDFFEQELNSVFCNNNKFLEDGETIGLLQLEKEITGDIVQGLPRIEEILEARKKNQLIKRIPSSQKKSLLTQTTSLDQNFEFCKLGTPIQENEKINPHKLLKVYFNYYGFLKPFFCDRQRRVQYMRLLSNFEGSYKSFKKVQAFILNSVQGVYKSQGVRINNKHLEVIIKQMTTKVIITDEGDTPLLKREVVDLYHIEHMNKIMQQERKNCAYYLPLLFGITRAALNNPSFISAASFQETTRVLTKSAIEGRMDWLRGLKENIIIGQLIPAGTGSRNYKHNFKKPLFVSSNKIVSPHMVQT